jgi:conserved oligomeric Golgi complex subunit 5
LLSKPTDQIAQLQFNIDFLRKQIDRQVLDSHSDLLDGVKDLGIMDGIVKDTTQHVRELRQTYNALREKIQVPFQSIQKTSLEIRDLNKQVVILRSISNLLQVFSRLEGIMDDVEEYPRAAFEIQSIINDKDFESIPLIEEELQRSKEFHSLLSTTGLEWIKEGIEKNNQILISKSIHLFSNLRNVPETIQGIFDEYQLAIQKVTCSCFDMEAIKTQLIESRKLQTGQKQGNASALAEILWTRVDNLTDDIYNCASHIQVLESYLSRKKDNFTQISLLQNVLTTLGYPSLRSQYWQILSQNVDKEIRAATKSNPVLLQILQFGYPKLLRIFSDLFSKVALLTGNEEQKETAVLKKTLSSFENAYVSRTLTRMLDMVNTLIPEKNGMKSNPSVEEANKLCRSFSSELNAVRFDGHLLHAVCKNVTKALHLFRSRLVQSLGTSSFTISGSSPGSAQIQKIDVVNCLYALSEGLWGMLSEFEDTVAEQIVEEGARATNDLMITIVEPLFLSVIQDLEAVLPKMHREEYSTTNLVSRTDPQSLYLNEYTSKIRWVFRELVSKLLCKSVTGEWYHIFIQGPTILSKNHVFTTVSHLIASTE